MENNQKAGTIEYMQSKIKHVVYYMLENRSFDHICGWLYEKDIPNKFIGSQEPYNGASLNDFNNGPDDDDPLPGPKIQEGSWSSINTGHQLIPLGNTNIGYYFLDWVATDSKSTYKLPIATEQFGIHKMELRP